LAGEVFFLLYLSREIPKDSEAYFTGTRPLMGDPYSLTCLFST